MFFYFSLFLPGDLTFPWILFSMFWEACNMYILLSDSNLIWWINKLDYVVNLWPWGCLWGYWSLTNKITGGWMCESFPQIQQAIRAGHGTWPYFCNGFQWTFLFQLTMGHRILPQTGSLLPSFCLISSLQSCPIIPIFVHQKLSLFVIENKHRKENEAKSWQTKKS